eukprot:6024717-Pyramimonas_sp.AAC.1
MAPSADGPFDAAPAGRAESSARPPTPVLVGLLDESWRLDTRSSAAHPLGRRRAATTSHCRLIPSSKSPALEPSPPSAPPPRE